MEIEQTGHFAKLSYQGVQTPLNVLKIDGRLVLHEPDSGIYFVAISDLEKLESILNISSMVDAV